MTRLFLFAGCKSADIAAFQVLLQFLKNIYLDRSFCYFKNISVQKIVLIKCICYIAVSSVKIFCLEGRGTGF